MDETENIINVKDENVEDTTLYGEFISTFHGWVSQEEQKKEVDKLENITKTRKKSSNS